MTSDAAAGDSLTTFRLLSSLIQQSDRVCDATQQQNEKNAEVRKLIEWKSEERAVLTAFLLTLSDQNLLLRDTLKLTDEKTKGLAVKKKKVRDNEEKKRQLIERREEREVQFQTHMNEIAEAIRSENQKRDQLVTDAVSGVTAQFVEELAELDAQMEADIQKAADLQKEMEQMDGLLRAKTAGLRQHAEKDSGKRKDEFVKKMARLDADIDKLDPQHEGQKVALRRETDHELDHLQRQLQQKREERKRLRDAVDMLPECERRQRLDNVRKQLAQDSPRDSSAEKRQLALRSGSLSPATKKNKLRDTIALYQSFRNKRK